MCEEVVDKTVQDIVNACLPEIQGGSLLLDVMTTSDQSFGENPFFFSQDLIFKHDVELTSEFLNGLQACIDESVDTNIATQTLQDNASIKCDDFEASTVAFLTIEGASRSRVSYNFVCVYLQILPQAQTLI